MERTLQDFMNLKDQLRTYEEKKFRLQERVATLEAKKQEVRKQLESLGFDTSQPVDAILTQLKQALNDEYNKLQVQLAEFDDVFNKVMSYE